VIKTRPSALERIRDVRDHLFRLCVGVTGADDFAAAVRRGRA
jgi:hypothetical protein